MLGLGPGSPASQPVESDTSFLVPFESQKNRRKQNSARSPPHSPTVSTHPVSCYSPQPGLWAFSGPQQGTLVQAESAESLCSNPLGCWGSACEPKVEKGVKWCCALPLPGPLDPTSSPFFGTAGCVISLGPQGNPTLVDVFAFSQGLWEPRRLSQSPEAFL